MALPLCIPPCCHTPKGPYHFPPPEKPLRIQIVGPFVAIQRLFPHMTWNLDRFSPPFPQPAAPELARLTYQKIYGRDVCPETPNDLVVRDEWLGRKQGEPPIITPTLTALLSNRFLELDHYGVAFDHLVPADDPDPEVLQINIIEVEDDNGAFANEYMGFAIDPAEFVGKKVLAVPRCCQKRKGTQDRGRVNLCVRERDEGRWEAKSFQDSGAEWSPEALQPL